ncbi:hypothetical protein [Streptomyces sp. cg35]|uniref:hypothetical protein n=1 Tax=Streptomyces sp. cg35 TaxID=3421650 RepID=UPI003D16AADF
MSESEYAVSSEETRKIAEMFLAGHPYLRHRWGHHFGDTMWMDFSDEPRKGALWGVEFTDPTGQVAVVDHEVVLSGLRKALYERSSIEDGIVVGWMSLKTAAEREAQPLPWWAASRVCQLGLFGDAGQQFPFQGHKVGDTLDKRREFLDGFLEPSPAEQDQ